jgi:hypothetical protein
VGSPTALQAWPPSIRMRRAGKNVGKLKFLNGFNGKFMGKSIINGGSVCKSIEVNDGFLIDHL